MSSGTPRVTSEKAAYLSSGGTQLYSVFHKTEGSRAAVLMLGPFALERTFSYGVIVRWARRLADAGFDVLRFDYRGNGESGGDFEKLQVGDWLADAQVAFDHLRELCPGRRIVVHGFRFGAVLASELFIDSGEALMLWDPPESGHAHLYEVLRRKLASDLMVANTAERKSRDAYVADLERGSLVEVEGYLWSQSLWRSAKEHRLQLPTASDSRLWEVLHLDGRPAERCIAPGHSASVKLPRPPFWGTSPVLTPDVGELEARTLAWYSIAVPEKRSA